MRFSAPAYAFAAGMTFCAGTAAADVMVLVSDRDNTLYESETGHLSNGAGPGFYVGLTNTLQLRRALLHFDASAIPAGSIITEVSLTLVATRVNGGGLDIGLHRALEDWGEGTSNAGLIGGMGAPATPGDATWIHQFFDTDLWATVGGTFAGAASSSANVSTIGSYTWNSTPALVADVQGWLDGTVSNFGWELVSTESEMGVAKAFESRESQLVELRPQLTVTFVPGPPGAAVLGLAALSVVRRRRA